MPVGQILFESPYICVTISIGFGALSVFFAIFDLTDIFIAIFEGVFTLSVKGAVLESAHVALARRVRLSALAVLFTVFPLSNVFAPIRFYKSAQSAFQTILEGAYVNVTICRIIRALSVRFIILEITTICVASERCIGTPGFYARTGLYTIRPPTLIFAAI